LGGVPKKRQDAYAKFLIDDFEAVEADGYGERSKQRLLSEVERCMYSDYLQSNLFPFKSFLAVVGWTNIFNSIWWSGENK